MSPTMKIVAWATLVVCFVIISILVILHQRKVPVEAGGKHRVKEGGRHVKESGRHAKPMRPRRPLHSALVIGLCFIGSTALMLVTIYVVYIYYGVPRDQFGHEIVGAIWLALFILAIGLWILFSSRTRDGLYRSAAGMTTAFLAVLACGLVINQFYAIYPVMGALFPQHHYRTATLESLPQASTVSVAKWKQLPPHPSMPEQGTIVKVTPPATRSGFSPRPSWVYLPPAWFTNPRPQLPVLLVMAGVPGKPQQWFNEGAGSEAAHQYQKNHGGLSPIIVAADASGAWFSNPVCTDSSTAKIETFLTTDIPRWIIRQFDANPNRRTWTIGGISYGGTCALQIITNYPESFGAFVNLSGERTPNDGYSHETTVNSFFGGDEEKFWAKNPETLMQNRRYDGIEGKFFAGENDSSAREDMELLHQVSRESGMTTTFTATPGGHDFLAWRKAIVPSTEFAARIGGLQD